MKESRITNCRFNSLKKYLRQSAVVGCTVCFGFLLSSKSAQAAQTVLFQDDFTQMLGRTWNVARNEQWPDRSAPCMNLTSPAQWENYQQQLKIEIAGSHCFTDLVPSSLNLSGIPSYSLSLKLTLPDSVDMDRSIPFLWQDANNWYDIKLYGHSIELQKVINGVAYPLAGSLSNYPFQPNQAYPITIEVFQQQHYRVTIGSQVVMDVSDHAPFLPAATAKTFAFRGNVGAVSRSITLFDDVEVKAEIAAADLISLNVPLYKQTDPLWKDQEYDHATSWSDRPTIQRWGCAMTSMVMILRYHKITVLPTGEPITPSSLNTWLQSQPDGYFSGSINWLAVTRLTRLINAKYGTPKLEFIGSASSHEQNVALAKQEIQNKRPNILGISGHFFVADGLNKKTDELLIKDPAYTYTLLSQHHQPVLSVRRFIPSYTDLSYLAFAVPEGMTFSLQSSSGQELPLLDVSEHITDPTEENGQQSPTTRVMLFAKPTTGDYQLKFSQTESKPYQFKIYSYDAAGNVTTQNQSGVVGQEGSSSMLHFDKQTETVSTQPQTQQSWRQFRLTLRRVYQLRQIHHALLSLYVDYIAQLAEQAPKRQHSQYAQILKQIIRTYRSLIQPSAFELLNIELERLRQQPYQDKN